MKKFSKILSVALLVALVLSLGVANAFAAGTNTISVQNAKNGEKYNIYRLLDLSVTSKNVSDGEQHMGRLLDRYWCWRSLHRY